MLTDILSVLCEYHGHHQGHQYAAEWILSFGHCFLRRVSVTPAQQFFAQRIAA